MQSRYTTFTWTNCHQGMAARYRCHVLFESRFTHICMLHFCIFIPTQDICSRFFIIRWQRDYCLYSRGRVCVCVMRCGFRMLLKSRIWMYTSMHCIRATHSCSIHLRHVNCAETILQEGFRWCTPREIPIRKDCALCMCFIGQENGRQYGNAAFYHEIASKMA